jgi:uncharacterized protein YhaN
MANETETETNEVDTHGDHDRVAMLSLRADGTPDQNNPELIGDKDAALAATKEQFRQQAVSSVDQKLRGVSSDADSEKDVETLTKAHEEATQAAEAAAEQAVNSLHKGDGEQ